jgi:CRISPR type I-E-associated protein CasB/Cse2
MSHGGLEPQLRWALSVISKGPGVVLDWAALLDDLRWWDREKPGHRPIREKWAHLYLSETNKIRR